MKSPSTLGIVMICALAVAAFTAYVGYSCYGLGYYHGAKDGSAVMACAYDSIILGQEGQEGQNCKDAAVVTNSWKAKRFVLGE